MFYFSSIEKTLMSESEFTQDLKNSLPALEIMS